MGVLADDVDGALGNNCFGVENNGSLESYVPNLGSTEAWLGVTMSSRTLFDNDIGRRRYGTGGSTSQLQVAFKTHSLAC